MKKNSSILICAVVAVFYFGLAASLQAVPPPPVLDVPDSTSTGIMLAAALGGVGFLKWKLKR